jgi:hypothetical protein
VPPSVILFEVSMNKAVEQSLKVLQAIVKDMNGVKVSNHSQYCDRLRAHIFSNWRDDLSFHVDKLASLLQEPEKPVVQADVKAEKPKAAVKVTKTEVLTPTV